VVLHSPLAEGRIQALAVLGSFEDGLNEEVIVSALRDVHPRVQQQIFWQLGKKRITFKQQEYLSAEIVKIAAEGSLESQFWLALYLGQIANYQPELRQDPLYVEVAGNLVLKQLNQDRLSELAYWPEYVLAVEWCLGPHSLAMLERLLAQDVSETSLFEPWIESLLFGSLKHRPTAEVLDRFTEAWKKFSRSDKADQAQIAQRLIEALGRKFSSATAWCRTDADQAMQVWLKSELLPRIEMALDQSRGIQPRDLLGWELLERLPTPERYALLEKALKNDVSAIVQIAALKTMAANEGSHFDLILRQLDELSPEVYAVALETLAGREMGAAKLLDAMERNEVAAGTLPSEIWLTLERLPDEKLAARGKKLHSGLLPTVAWEEVAAGYRKAWEEKPDLENGRVVFRKLCSSCHRVENEGTNIGPPLASVIEKSNEQIALSVFQPNAEVDPRYQMYQLITDDGVVHTGLMESSQGDVVVIRNAKAELERFQRVEIEVLKASGKSLMPEGLLAQMKPQDFRDVIGFIREYAGRSQSSIKNSKE
jgi:putative heme-binding domain-containing protein